MNYKLCVLQKVVNDAYKVLIPKESKAPPEQMFCNLLNISACNFTEINKQVSIILDVFNCYSGLIHSPE